MASCDHIAWLRHIQHGETGEVVLEDTGRLERVVGELPRKDDQTPQLAFFIGAATKDAAVKQIFSHNNIGRRGEKGNINLRLETTSSDSDTPLLFADSNPFTGDMAERSHVLCHETVPYSTTWKPGGYPIIHILYPRLFFMFCDIICLFADDFDSPSAVVSQIMMWTEIGNASSLPPKLKPRLLIVIAETSPAEVLLGALELGSVRLAECFSTVNVFQLAGEYLSPLARYQRLRNEVHRQREEMLQVKTQNRMLFSATHLAFLFRAAVKHTAQTITHNICFLAAARAHNPVRADYLVHLKTFISLAKAHRAPYSSVASFIASSILMDAYPPRAHHFPIEMVFSIFYRSLCYKALDVCYNNPCTRHLCSEIERYCCELFEKLEAGYISSSRLHWGNTASLDHSISFFRSNTTCLHCLRRLPEQHLSCGHSVCHQCIRIFGVGESGREDRQKMRCIYNDGGEITVDIKPSTAGIRMMSVDGGGTRGVTPLEYMKEMQKLLRGSPLHEMVDIASGSSSGALIVLAKFHLKWPIERCANMFESFALRCFRRSKSFLGILKSAVNYLATDAIYNEAILKTLLQEAYGEDQVFFGPVSNVVSGTRVAVTAMTHGSRRIVFKNFNGSLEDAIESPEQEFPYTTVRPKNINDEPFIWQVARATSAAPMFFKPLRIGTDEFWDGALGFPNPINLAQSEASRIWPETNVDVAISIGTGEEPRRLKSTNSLTRLFDCFNLLTDGEFHFLNMKNGLKPDQALIRLNTELPYPIRLDATDELQIQRDNVHQSIKSQQRLLQSAMALLVSNFYFELDYPLLYDLGVYYCQGTICCRGDYPSIADALENLLQGPYIEFITGSEILSRTNLHEDVCSVCHRYRKKVNFTTRHPTDLITISIRVQGGTAWKISGFPQNMAWFQAQQGLDNHFGNTDHDSPGLVRCLACRETRAPRIRKRRPSSLFYGPPAKKIKH